MFKINILQPSFVGPFDVVGPFVYNEYAIRGRFPAKRNVRNARACLKFNATHATYVTHATQRINATQAPCV